VALLTFPYTTLFRSCVALLDEGDEAVIPNPYWVSYPEMVRLAGAKPVELMLRQEDGWSPRPEDLEKLLTPRTRVFMFSSPSNPRSEERRVGKRARSR